MIFCALGGIPFVVAGLIEVVVRVEDGLHLRGGSETCRSAAVHQDEPAVGGEGHYIGAACVEHCDFVGQRARENPHAERSYGALQKISAIHWALTVAHALVRAVSRLISTHLADSGRSHECERGTQECVRHNGATKLSDLAQECGWHGVRNILIPFTLPRWCRCYRRTGR